MGPSPTSANMVGSLGGNVRTAGSSSSVKQIICGCALLGIDGGLSLAVAKESSNVMNTLAAMSLIEEAGTYPLLMRVAVKLHLNGQTEVAFADGVKDWRSWPAVVTVRNYLWDIDRGQMYISPRLRQLAEAL